MSDESRSESTHRSDNDCPSVPRAIIHKQILDRAKRDPDATMEAIADDISGVTVATVERVLEEYGDPCAEPPSSSESAGAATAATPTATDGGAMSDPGRAGADDIERSAGSESEPESGPSSESDPETEAEAKTDDPVADTDPDESADRSPDATDAPDPDVPAFASLTDKQRETLRAIAERPAATQAELAEELGVSSPTISQRVNSIDGFDWSNRHEFVDAVLDDASDERPAPEAELDGGDADGRPTVNAQADSEPDATGGAADRSTATRESRASAVDRRDDPTDGSAEERPERRDRVDELARTVASLADAVDTMRSEQRREPPEMRDGAETRDRVRERDGDQHRDRRARDATDETGSSVFDDPELAHKIVRACVHSDRITEAEELRIVREIAGGATAPSTE